MSLRSRLLSVLSRDEPSDADPDEYGEFAVVSLAQGPLLVAQLERAGIDARGADAFDPVTEATNKYRVWVRRRLAERATEVTTPS